ncbi:MULTISPECIES: DUF4232 domain-containing protein [unclassified Pseudofrankia]|uniref:DUF4232 domain-containing protein n=1 Tax=unclassified Pseudofrankia TaxID=2994372 RepID=UPI0008DB290C|nr:MULTISPECIES: DUF4232 domain-containing protein [unclassified Pseudofrankia]MDT3443962.1 DUF4232 domain-containing protein [Pseudofrankia sp. BMG5.37]OHV44374.1 hypothetical protein BCD48_02155 [Pseudofrankia sp. BMG5.36]
MRTDRVRAPACRWHAGAPRAGRAKAAAVAAVAFGLVLAGSGCGSTVAGGGPATVAAGSSGAGSRGPAQSVAPSASGRGGGIGGSGVAAAAAGSSAAPKEVAAAPVCAAGALTGKLDDIEGAAGQVYGKLVLTNAGPATCKLNGFPDVRFVDARGAEFGAPADHDDSRPVPGPALLAPGGTATAVLRITQPGVQQGCLTSDVTREASALGVTPPGGTGTVSVELSGGVTACVSTDVRQLLIGPLSA